MRISDWGSDVCSSDLLLRVDAGAEGVFLRRLGEAVHRLADKLRQLARILRGAVERAGRVVIAREDILAFVGEIGRATCRERVCPYVYIWVVDGSVKKKQK